MPGMRRREFVSLLGGAAAAWPLAARAQQPAMPVIGFLNLVSPDSVRGPSARISPGLEGHSAMSRAENIAIEYRWAEDQRSAAGAGGRIGSSPGRRDRRARRLRLRRSRPRRQPRRSPSFSAPPRTRSGIGLVSSLARPGGNLTGVNISLESWRQSGLSFCANWCPKPFAWPCSSIQPMSQVREPP